MRVAGSFRAKMVVFGHYFSRALTGLRNSPKPCTRTMRIRRHLSDNAAAYEQKPATPGWRTRGNDVSGLQGQYAGNEFDPIGPDL